ncbi:hypothetical protein ACFW16_32555 [Inquilinus sp. NPDC058860]|uniref:hypothetical protein n=1 Tax=Inquilinus sp. NPDC058860 TaxID=3346652 RepID=UPI0036C83AAC
MLDEEGGTKAPGYQWDYFIGAERTIATMVERMGCDTALWERLKSCLLEELAPSKGEIEGRLVATYNLCRERELGLKEGE